MTQGQQAEHAHNAAAHISGFAEGGTSCMMFTEDAPEDCRPH